MPSAAYIRVSTDEQAKEGFSIEAQGRILQAYAVVKGLGEVDLYTDEGYSAKNLNRPAVQSLLAACKQGRYSTVLVWRLDRLSRSIRDTLEIFEDIFNPNHIEFISTTESIDTSNPSGRLMLNILASFAQNEREVNEERVRMVSQDLAQKCRHLGGVPPFGYKVVDGYYQIDEGKAVAVREIFQMFTARQGYAAILDYLNGHGYQTARGRPFGKNSLYDLLGNEKYAGVYTYNRSMPADRSGKRNHHKSKDPQDIVRIPGGMPAIIDQETWERVLAMRKENKERPAAHAARNVYLLSGIAVCGVCGAKISGNTGAKDRDGTPQRYYGCRNKCVPSLRKEKAEEAVYSVLEQYLENEQLVRDAADVANTLAETREREQPADIREAQARLDVITQRIAAIIDFIATNGASAPAKLADELSLLESQEQELRLELNDAKAAVVYVDAETVLANLRAAVNAKNRPLEEQKTAIQKAVCRVVIADDALHVTLDCGLSGGGGGNRISLHSINSTKYETTFSKKSPILLDFPILTQWCTTAINAHCGQNCGQLWSGTSTPSPP